MNPKVKNFVVLPISVLMGIVFSVLGFMSQLHMAPVYTMNSQMMLVCIFGYRATSLLMAVVTGTIVTMAVFLSLSWIERKISWVFWKCVYWGSLYVHQLDLKCQYGHDDEEGV